MQQIYRTGIGFPDAELLTVRYVSKLMSQDGQELGQKQSAPVIPKGGRSKSVFKHLLAPGRRFGRGVRKHPDDGRGDQETHPTKVGISVEPGIKNCCAAA